MPAIAIPFLIGSAVAAGGEVAGAVISSKASKSAAKTQKAATDQSLAIRQQQYADAQQRYAPFVQTGTNVLPTLQGLAGNVQAPRYGDNLAALSIYGAPPPMRPQSPPMAPSGGGGPIPVGTGQTPQVAQRGTGTVIMRAPNGLTKAVPRELQAHYEQQGATVVPQNAYAT